MMTIAAVMLNALSRLHQLRRLWTHMSCHFHVNIHSDRCGIAKSITLARSIHSSIACQNVHPMVTSGCGRSHMYNYVKVSQPYHCLHFNHSKSFQPDVDCINKLRDFTYSTKSFYPEEKGYYHTVLVQNPAYEKLMFPIQTKNPVVVDIFQVTAKNNRVELYSDLSSVLNKGNFSWQIMTEFLDKLSKLPIEDRRCFHFTESFQRFSSLLAETLRSMETGNFFDVLKALLWYDSEEMPLLFSTIVKDEYLKRFQDWDVAQCLLAAHFLTLPLSKHRKRFSREWQSALFSKIEKNLSSLEPQELVLTSFYATFAGALPSGMASNICDNLNLHWDKFSFDEVGVICLGFFRIKVPYLSQSLLCKIADTLKKGIVTANSFPISSIFKCLRLCFDRGFYSKNVYVFNALTDPGFISALTSRILHLDIICIHHVFYFYQHGGWIPQILLDIILNKVCSDNLSDFRLKELSTFLFLICSINSDDFRVKKFCNLAAQEIMNRRKDETMQFPRAFLQCLLGLAQTGYYTPEMLHYFFSRRIQEKIKDALKEIDFRYDLFNLDQSVRIECPSYRGNLLSPELMEQCLMKSSQIFYIHPTEEAYTRNPVSERQKLVYNVVKDLRSLVDTKKFVIVDFLLPHYSTSDIAICLDQKQNPVPFDQWEHWIRSPFSVRKNLEKNQYQIVVLALRSWRVFCIMRMADGSETYQVYSHQRMKERQLRQVGYHVEEVFIAEYEAAKDKIEYLKQKIFGRTK
ncbi:hypothetical protein CHS0354_002762 [Potamilus streckersoni]|uniref:FAST kinase-like protein subdomain 2 domain-containing protein n=1 Tax=Potamilus streckersoni TaxID=2493646 RepID=A0AAE0SN65_9BIVA|nr:hypothetical protein CHS0354_002762 [Potamilus streckersoni]